MICEININDNKLCFTEIGLVINDKLYRYDSMKNTKFREGFFCFSREGKEYRIPLNDREHLVKDIYIEYLTHGNESQEFGESSNANSEDIVVDVAEDHDENLETEKRVFRIPRQRQRRKVYLSQK